MVGGLVDLNAGSSTQTGKRLLRIISGLDCLKRRLMNNHLLTEKLVSQGHMHLTSRHPPPDIAEVQPISTCVLTLVCEHKPEGCPCAVALVNSARPYAVYENNCKCHGSVQFEA